MCALKYKMTSDRLKLTVLVIGLYPMSELSLMGFSTLDDSKLEMLSCLDLIRMASLRTPSSRRSKGNGTYDAGMRRNKVPKWSAAPQLTLRKRASAYH